MFRRRRFLRLSPLVAAGLLLAVPALGESPVTATPIVAVPFADLADLADSAPLVIRVQIRKMTQLEPERARGVRPGQGRFFVEARTEGLIAGNTVLGEAQRYLVDLPLDAKGKPPALKKKSVLLFARAVPGRPGELQLVAPDAQLLWDAPTDQRLRAIIAALIAPDAPPRLTGVREAIYVPGNLAGEGETQLFLAAANDQPAALIVERQAGEAPRWSVTFSEVVAADGTAPLRDTLAWYRLACFLPAELPRRANVSATASDRTRAAEDYRFVLTQLGPCGRLRG